MFYLSLRLLPVVLLLAACGGESGGGVDYPITFTDFPTSISWTEPQQNTDSSELVDLEKYRFYYGSSPSRLTAITALDLPADSANPLIGSVITYEFTAYDISIMTPLLTATINSYGANAKHYFAITSINTDGFESSYSNIVEYTP
jgi:hypothetical protein